MFICQFFSLILKLYKVSQDPCIDGNSLELDHMTERSPSINTRALLCEDMNIKEAWYKAKNYVMTTSRPGVYGCGSLWPVWLCGI